jgi:hypothetical protein
MYCAVGTWAQGTRTNAAGDGPQQHVAVALIEDEAGFGNILPRHVKDKGRDRHEAPVLPGGHDLITAQNLAARDAAKIGPHDMDAFNIGILIEKGLRFGFAAGKHECHFTLLLSPSVP